MSDITRNEWFNEKPVQNIILDLVKVDKIERLFLDFLVDKFPNF